MYDIVCIEAHDCVFKGEEVNDVLASSGYRLQLLQTVEDSNSNFCYFSELDGIYGMVDRSGWFKVLQNSADEPAAGSAERDSWQAMSYGYSQWGHSSRTNHSEYRWKSHDCRVRERTSQFLQIWATQHITIVDSLHLFRTFTLWWQSMLRWYNNIYVTDNLIDIMVTDSWYARIT